MWELGGSFVFSTAYNYAHDSPAEEQADYRGFSRLRGQLELELELRLPREWKTRVSGLGYYDAIYYAREREEYTDEVLDAYEKEAEFNEVYLQGSLSDNVDVKVGRQIVVWGKSDNIRVTDILNPLDSREPGMVDIKYLRLPVAMTRLDYYLGNWNLTGILIHEARFSKRPAFGSDFLSFSSLPPPEKKPANKLENTQYAAALSGIFGGWDIAFYIADVFDDRCYTEVTLVPLERVRRHNRVHMAGTAANIAKGNWLFKAEAAYFEHLKYSAPSDHSKTRYDILAGVEYSGFSDTTISLEAVNCHIAGFEEAMGEPPDSAQENEFQSALRLTRNFLHDTLHLSYLVSLFDVDGSDGGLQRFWVEYDISDFIKVTAGIVGYKFGDTPPFNAIGDNDRIFVELRYCF